VWGQLLTLDEESVGGSMEPLGNAAYAEELLRTDKLYDVERGQRCLILLLAGGKLE